MKSVMTFSRRRATVVLALLAVSVAMPSVARSAADQQADHSRRPAWQFAVTDDSRAAGCKDASNPAASAQYNGGSTVVMGAIARDIAAHGVDFVLFPGDMITGEVDDSAAVSSMLGTWMATMAPVYDAGIPVYVTRGNHEYNPKTNGSVNVLDPSRQPFLDHFDYLPHNGPTGEKGLTYAITHKNVKVIGFDQYANRSASYDNHLYAPGSNAWQTMNPWVIDEVNSSNAPLTFVMAHEQIWPTVSHSDCLANDPTARDALVHALASRGTITCTSAAT